MQIIEKKDVIITKYTTQESMGGMNPNPYLKNKKGFASSEVLTLMSSHNLSREEAEKIHRENMEWANG